MIRKAVIVLLTLATVGVGTALIESYRKPRGKQLIYLDMSYADGYTWGWLLRYGSLVIDSEKNFPAERVGSESAVSFAFSGLEFAYDSHLVPHYPTWGGRLPIPRPSSEQFGTWKLHIQFPLWLPLVLLVTYPTIAFMRGPVRRWRRRRKGLCVACGYDLTGNVSGVCSECGAEI